MPPELDFEVVVVDDNSPDGTAEAVRQNFAANPRVKLFVRTEGRGLATAIRYGVEHSTGEILVFMDTDFNHDPTILPQMVKFLEYYDIIIGSRFVMAGGMEDKFRQFSSRIYNYAIRLLFGTPVHDNLSGFFSIYRDKLLSMDLDQIYYGYGDYFIRLLMVGNNRLQNAGSAGFFTACAGTVTVKPNLSPFSTNIPLRCWRCG
jgi:dolichol-phosphate mannosyltransferase